MAFQSSTKRGAVGTGGIVTVEKRGYVVSDRVLCSGGLVV